MTITDETLDCSRCHKAITRAEWQAHLAWHGDPFCHRPTCRNDDKPVYLQGLCGDCWAEPAP